MKRVMAAQVKAAIRNYGKWEGYILPCKANPRSPWFDGVAKVTLTAENFKKFIGEFEYYNCNAELGRYAAFYEETVPSWTEVEV